MVLSRIFLFVSYTSNRWDLSFEQSIPVPFLYVCLVSKHCFMFSANVIGFAYHLYCRKLKLKF